MLSAFILKRGELHNLRLYSVTDVMSMYCKINGFSFCLPHNGAKKAFQIRQRVRSADVRMNLRVGEIIYDTQHGSVEDKFVFNKVTGETQITPASPEGALQPQGFSICG